MLGLGIAYLYTTFDHSSFSRSRGVVGAHHNLNSSNNLTIVSSMARELGHPTINLPTKYEVSISTHYKIKKATKCGKWGCFQVVMGHPKMTQGH